MPTTDQTMPQEETTPPSSPSAPPNTPSTPPADRVLLPNLIFGRPYAELPNGDFTYITAQRKLVCRHGENASTIQWWLAQERRAAETGLPPPTRGGSRGHVLCDCQTTEGLNFKNIAPGACLPCLPSSLFTFLEETGADKICVRGQAAHRIPYLAGPTYLTATGNVVCKHGTRLPRSTKCRSSRRACGCVLPLLPARSAFKAVALGKYRSGCARVLIPA